MRKELSSKKDFEESNNRKLLERKETERNLSKEKKQELAGLKEKKKKALREMRKEQKRRHDEDVAKKMKKLIERKPKLELLPPGKIRERKEKEIKRQAIRNVADDYSKEISNLKKKYDHEMNRFLDAERIKMRKKFKEKSRGEEGRER